MLKSKRARRKLINIVFDGVLYIGIGVSIGMLLNSPMIGFMGVLMASMMKRGIGWMYDWIEDGRDDLDDEYYPSMPPTDQRVKFTIGQEDDGEI